MICQRDILVTGYFMSCLIYVRLYLCNEYNSTVYIKCSLRNGKFIEHIVYNINIICNAVLSFQYFKIN